jgi:hypothetical protein
MNDILAQASHAGNGPARWMHGVAFRAAIA